MGDQQEGTEGTQNAGALDHGAVVRERESLYG